MVKGRRRVPKRRDDLEEASDPDGHGENAPSAKRIKMEDAPPSQDPSEKGKNVSSGSRKPPARPSSRVLTPAEAARARWANPGAAAAGTSTAGPSAHAAQAAPVADSSTSAALQRQAIHRRPQPPRPPNTSTGTRGFAGDLNDWAGLSGVAGFFHQPPIDRSQTPLPWPKRILRALDKQVGKHQESSNHVYIAACSSTDGYKGGDGPEFELLGTFRSFESANVKVMEHVWEHYEESLETEELINAPILRDVSYDMVALVWWVNPDDGSLVLHGLNDKWGSYKAWVERREIEA